jgi:hypothetical protein
VIRRNRIHNLHLGIFINWTGGEERGNDTRIEYNEIYDPPVNEWSWDAVKGTSMEGTAVIVRGHIGTIVRGNDIHNYFNGIYTGSSAAAAIENPAVALDADIYANRLHEISDDAFEPEGACVNHRFRENIVDGALVGASLAPITQGPAWILRNQFTNYGSRSIKFDRNSDGLVLIYHNTSWTEVRPANAVDLISPAHNTVMHNNIFQSGAYAVNGRPTGSTGHDWNYDNWFTPSAEPHFKWENRDYDTVAELCAASGLECNGFEAQPGLSNPGSGDISLLPSSPNIDRGALIPGINEAFAGSAPDIGAVEFVPDPVPAVSSSLRLDPNPTGARGFNFSIVFSET